MKLVYTLLLFFISAASLITSSSKASNILGLFPHHGYSHFKVYYPILRALAERGHHVTAVTYISAPEQHPNYQELLLSGFETVHSCTLNFTTTRHINDLYIEYVELHKEGQESCEAFYSSGLAGEILQRHRKVPYDLVIMEFFNTDCYMGLPYLLNAPVVGISSCTLMPWHYDRILLPDTPSFVQSEFIGFPELMSWNERLVNFVQAKFLKLAYRYYTNYYDNKLVQKYLNVTMDVDAYAKSHTSLILVNQHYSLMGNRPFTRQLIEIGGVHITAGEENDALPQEIEEFLSRSEHDVLFISWGSNIKSSSLDPAKFNEIIQALDALPLTVIWKWESERVPAINKKFMFIKWAPQLQLLCHPKVKYFWGHGGLLGVTEAVHCGKPLILTPIYGDQFVNANAVRNRQIGALLNFNDISTASVRASIEEIMLEKYSKRVKQLSSIFRQRQNAPLDSAVWWIEHVLEHKPLASDVLHMKAVQLNWFQYHSLDSVMLLLSLLILTMCIVKRSSAAVWRRLWQASLPRQTYNKSNNNNKVKAT